MLLSDVRLYDGSLFELNDSKMLINTLNAHSYNMAVKNHSFFEALKKSTVLLPDGISIVWSIRFLWGVKLKKIAGADLFQYEMNRLNTLGGRCFFLGSKSETLKKIKERAHIQYPNVKIECFSPPYKDAFTELETTEMIEKINAFSPDVLFVGMTAPKQEIWASQNFERINSKHIDCIGAVFDFYAGTVKRAPSWIIKIGLEWLYRFLNEPRRLWKRYLVGNVKFIWYVLLEKLGLRK